MISLLLRIALSLALLIAADRPLRAQFGGVLRGDVVDQQSGAGIASARVLVDGKPTSHADSTGRFVVTGLLPGEHSVRVERLGYRGAELLAVVGDSLYVTIEMEPKVEPLPAVRAISLTPSLALVPERMRPFELRRRQNTGSGRLISRDGIDSLGVSTLLDALRRLPGARIIHAGAAMEDYLATGELPGPHAMNHPPSPCYAQVFVDGVQVFVRGGGDPPNLNTWDLNEIEAIEYYAKPSSTPVQFRTMNADCGTLVLWTRFAQ